jgi:uncharacterized protein YndB with AHSA1/START domain
VAVIKRSQTINARVEQVFDVIVDGANFAAWNPTIRASHALDAGPPGNGSRFEWELRGFGKVVQELQEFHPRHQVRIVPQLRQLAGGHRFRLTAQGDSTQGCRGYRC